MRSVNSHNAFPAITSLNLDDYIKDDLYLDHDGKWIDKESYKNRVLACVEMKENVNLDKNINCLEWVLTHEGNVEIIKYKIKDILLGNKK